MKKPVLFVIIGILSFVAIIGGVLLWRQNRAAEVTENETRVGVIPEVTAPDFTLADTGGNEVSLSALRGKYVILFFSGGLSCLTCLPQMGELSRDAGLNNGETVAFSVIPDPPSDWRKAREVSSSLAQARLLFDREGKVFQDYSALNISSLMRQGLHMSHTYFIIDKEGIIAVVLDDPAMGVRNELLNSALGKLKELETTTP